MRNIEYVLYDPREGGGPVYNGMAIRVYGKPDTARRAIKTLRWITEDTRQHLKVGVLDLTCVKEYTDDEDD